MQTALLFNLIFHITLTCWHEKLVLTSCTIFHTSNKPNSNSDTYFPSLFAAKTRENLTLKLTACYIFAFDSGKQQNRKIFQKRWHWVERKQICWRIWNLKRWRKKLKIKMKFAHDRWLSQPLSFTPRHFRVG